MNHVLRKERCPRCAKLGKDSSGDNLVVYSDGSSYCYGCGYFVASSIIQKFRTRSTEGLLETGGQTNAVINLPSDVEATIPQRALDWFGQYELTKVDLLKHNVLWSEEWKRLIFPYFIDGELLAWQGRYFGTDTAAPKWFSRGKLHEFIYTIGDRGSRCCVLVEDVVSAIKVSRYQCAVPIFGSVIGKKNWSRLTRFFSHAIIWLDRDKWKESLHEAEVGKMFGIDTRVISTELDPKELSYDLIREYLFADVQRS